jgi:hypothetical protein
LDEKIVEYISGNKDFFKKIYRFDRFEVLEELVARPIRMPLSIANIVFVINEKFVNDEFVKKITPEPFLAWWGSR